MQNEISELRWHRKVLQGAIWEQKQLVEQMPLAGYPSQPYEENLDRLRKRLIKVQKRIQELGFD